MEEFILWLDSESRIVSFHEEEGYEKIEFEQQEIFLNYILCTCNNGYRFQ